MNQLLGRADMAQLSKFKFRLAQGLMNPYTIDNTINQLKAVNTPLNMAKLEAIEKHRNKTGQFNMEELKIVEDEVEIYSLDEYAAVKYLQTMRNARRRGLDFDLTFNDIKRLVSKTHCQYTGLPFNPHCDELKLTLDRRDNKKGYVKGNVVACLNKINCLKNELTEIKGAPFYDSVELLISCVKKWKPRKSTNSQNQSSANSV